MAPRKPLSVSARGYVAGRAEFRYPELGDEPPPRGADVLLLTDGEVCVKGPWRDEGYIAWAPLPKSDREKVARVWELRRRRKALEAA